MSDETPESAVVLLSGGADSATLLAYVSRELMIAEVVALSFIYGQRHSREVDMARFQARAIGVRDHRVIDLGFFGSLTEKRTALAANGLPVPDLVDLDETQRRQPPTYVPHRNLVFLSLAAATAECAGVRDVYYGPRPRTSTVIGTARLASWTI
jgi:7-cyano-7-deazaguanine synthase